MLDDRLRRLIDPALGALGARLARRGLSADAVTLAGLVLGLAGAGAAAWRCHGLALAFVALNRLCDGLDGAIARAAGRTDRGGYLDIVCDFGFYAALPLGFALADPERNALPAAVLLASFYASGASFLAYAAIAVRREGTAAVRPKALAYTAGLAEGGETIAAFVLMCLAPAWFAWIAYSFAALCVLTLIGRSALAWRSFG